MKKGVVSKIVCSSLALILLSSSVYAAPKKSKKNSDIYKKLEKQKNPATKKVWNFKGMDIVVGDYWSDPDRPPVSQKQEDEFAFKAWVQDTYNFTMVAKNIGGWGSHPQTVANFCTTGGDENYIFSCDGRSVGPGIRASLFYELSSIESVDWDNPKWDDATKLRLGRNGKFYGMRPYDPEPRNGIIFNKRLLQEAGIDPESIYDMQANGTWTWETFEEVCKKCTRDFDNDGLNDVYAMASLSTEFCYQALDSNGACLIGRDENGKYFNAAGSEEAMEAWHWIRHMVDNYELPFPENANWDYMHTAFANGEVAFTCDAEYTMQQGGRFHDMKDDFGFVCFPLGPKSDGKYRTLHDDQMYIIPGCYDKERAEKIAKAFDLWTDPIPGYDNEDAWKEDFYPMFRDSRAVDETLVFMKENTNPRYDTLIAGFSSGSFIFNFWGGWATPQEQYEATKNEWQGVINDANR